MSQYRRLICLISFFICSSFSAGTLCASASYEKPDSTKIPDAREKIIIKTLSGDVDSMRFSHRYIHRLGIEVRPEYVIPSHSFLRGENKDHESINKAFSAHLKYSFQFHHNAILDRIYGGAYQGIGLSYYTFGEPHFLGNPVLAYLFQGARIAQLSPKLSLNYEWNFGISFGWKPYDAKTNPDNGVIGSKANAYINANVYFSWMLSQKVDFIAGVTLNHFSNGNTKIPNSGLNTTGLKIGIVYNFNRTECLTSENDRNISIPEYPKHISYDCVFFGAWRRVGVQMKDGEIASPNAYPVFGFNFSPLYNFGYKFKAGISFDGVYDGSTNVYADDYIISYGGSDPGPSFEKPPFRKQLALGISARAEYVMPYFTVDMGMGTNVLYSSHRLKYYYQVVALKMDITRHTFLHIGYTLKNFHNPNYLMLGIGFRLNDKRPPLH